MDEPHDQFDPTQIHVDAAQHERPWEHQASFQDVMADQIRHAPGLGISILLHAIVVLILFQVKLDLNTQEKAKAIEAAKPEEQEEIEEPPEEEEEEPEPEVEPEPVLQDVEITDEVEDDIEDIEDDTLVDSAFESDAFNDMIGIGGGAGGKFGHRGGGRRRLRGKGGGQTAESIRIGLIWLKNHQDPEGRWSADGFMQQCPAGDVCDGPGNPVNDVGVTGLALLAFLGDGSTMRSGPYKEQIKNGIKWLRTQQDDNGLIGAESSHEFIYNHAIASLSMIEAYGLSKYRSLRKYAQRAVDYICASRNPYKVWRYFPHDGENDTSVTGWMILALKSAQDFKLRIDANAFKYAEAWFDEVTDQSTGQCGYTKRGQPSSRKIGSEEKFPVTKTESLTAVGVLCRIFLGQKPDTHPILLQASDTMLKKPPVWNEADGSIDLYYWYYGSYALFQIGGSRWDKWRKAMTAAVVKTQRKDGHFRGSWNNDSVWGEDGGRVYSTAISVLCLEVYYRYTALIR